MPFSGQNALHHKLAICSSFRQQGQRIGESFRVAELILEQKEDLTRLATMGSLYISRLISLDYVRTREELASITDAMFTMLKTGQLNLLVSRVYALEGAGKAHVELESRRSTGKLLLSIGVCRSSYKFSVSWRQANTPQ